MYQHPLDDKSRREKNFNRSALNYQINHKRKPQSIVCGYRSTAIGVWPPSNKNSKKIKTSRNFPISG
jgi:hypothetical protein